MAFVYIFRSGNEDIFKIGHTRNQPIKRLKQLSTGNPYPFSVFDTIEAEAKQHTFCETFLHKKLRSKKFIAGDGCEFYAVSRTEIEAAIRDARKFFLEEFLPKQKEVARLAKQKSDGRIMIPGDIEKGIHRRLLEIREEQDRLELERTTLENDLKLALGSASELQGVATWKTISREDFNRAKFKIEQPKMYRTYLRLLQFRSFRIR